LGACYIAPTITLDTPETTYTLGTDLGLQVIQPWAISEMPDSVVVAACIMTAPHTDMPMEHPDCQSHTYGAVQQGVDTFQFETVVPNTTGENSVLAQVRGRAVLELLVWSSVVPGDSVEVPGDSVEVPGDSVEVPGDSTT
jgi:hypothetical protein